MAFLSAALCEYHCTLSADIPPRNILSSALAAALLYFGEIFSFCAQLLGHILYMIDVRAALCLARHMIPPS
jgi:hypothetical protein